MKLAEKILSLRKQNGLSQEELAEKLNVSRQAVSRWEMGTTLPDASNILQLSKLFQVSTDYLLNEEYEKEQDVPSIKPQKDFILLLVMQIICFVFHIIACFVLGGIPFFVIISLIINTFFVAKLYAEFPKYNLLSATVKKYYVNLYILIIWSMTYIPLIRANRFFLMTYSLIGEFTSFSSYNFEILSVFCCILPTIITTYLIKKKRKN